MRAVLGILGLVVVLAIVALVARSQLKSMAAPTGVEAPARESPRQVEERVRSELSKAMEAAASATRERADP
jgi:hypothetical protein